MNNKWFLWMIQAAAIGITMTALFQELEKPAEERAWRGTIAGFIPYDFRLPTIDRLRDAFWNPYERRILTPQVFGIGWAINLYAIFENIGITRQDASEESFLMPTESMKNAMEHTQAVD